MTEDQPWMPETVGTEEPAELRAADSGLSDGDPHLARPGLRVLEPGQVDVADPAEYQRLHGDPQPSNLVAASCIFCSAASGVSLLLSSSPRLVPNTSLTIC